MRYVPISVVYNDFYRSKLLEAQLQNFFNAIWIHENTLPLPCWSDAKRPNQRPTVSEYLTTVTC